MRRELVQGNRQCVRPPPNLESLEIPHPSPYLTPCGMRHRFLPARTFQLLKAPA
jgi:hypothetical protein